MSNKFDQLMLKKLLGTITPGEEKELVALVGQDANARKRYEESISSWKKRERDAPEFIIPNDGKRKPRKAKRASDNKDYNKKEQKDSGKTYERPRAQPERRDRIEPERREPVRPDRRESVRIDSEAIRANTREEIPFERRDPVQAETRPTFRSERRDAIDPENRVPGKSKPNRVAEGIAIFFVCLSSLLLFLGLKEYPQIHKSQNDIKTLMLKDSSSVTLKPKSAISVSGHYLKETRTVFLYGDAYFQVRREEEPFIVNTGSMQLHVDGTSFIVNASSKDSVEVLVMKGEVTIFPNSNPEKDITIKQGQKGVIYKNVNSIAITSFDSINALAWKEKILVFNKTRMEDVIPTLQDYFKVKIELKNEAIGNCRISRTFNQPNVVEVMEEIRRGLQLRMTREPGKFILEGKGCKFK